MFSEKRKKGMAYEKKRTEETEAVRKILIKVGPENNCRTLSPRGTQKWFSNGVLDRKDDYPAVLHPDGGEEWWVNGKKHRDNNLPADIRADGTRKWYLHGLLHRHGGPAVKYPDGTRVWYIFGKLTKYYCGRRKAFLVI